MPERPGVFTLPFMAYTDPREREEALIAALYGSRSDRGKAVLELNASRRLQPDGSEHTTYVGSFTAEVDDMQPVESDLDRMYITASVLSVTTHVELGMGLSRGDTITGYLWVGRTTIWFRRED